MNETSTTKPLAAAVVGTGHLGRHHVRILSQMPDINFIGAFDTNRSQLEAITGEHKVPSLDSFDAVCDADVVVVATPTVNHCESVCRLLASGSHVLVEKPIASSVAEADQMVEEATRADRVLAVGHVEFHNPAVQAALDLAENVPYLEAQRLSPFTARSIDVDVILDLMIHDLQITLALAGEEPTDIRAVGVPVLTDKVDLCHAWIEFSSGLVANLTASRVSAERIRKLRLFARDSYFSVDYAEQSVTSAQLKRSGPAAEIAPRIVDVTEQEPLKAELGAFVAACRGEASTSVPGQTGRNALAAAIAIRDQVEAR